MFFGDNIDCQASRPSSTTQNAVVVVLPVNKLVKYLVTHLLLVNNPSRPSFYANVETDQNLRYLALTADSCLPTYLSSSSDI